MSVIDFEGARFELAAGESVLDALLRNGKEIPHGCRGGACQSCILRGTAGDIPAKAQAGLKASQKQLGLFLSCSCYPAADLCVERSSAVKPKTQARVIHCQQLTPQVTRLRLEADLAFVPGQYINIWLDPQNLRSYSIASLPSEGFIELHVRNIPCGRFSGQVIQSLTSGDLLTVQGPMGECVYETGSPDQPLLLLASGTGLAPLYGIARDALLQNHSGSIHLICAAREAHGFYLQDELAELAAAYPQLQVSYLCQSSAPDFSGAVQADVYNFTKELYPSTKGMAIYLCGGESFVRKLKKQCFLAGASMQHIRSDVFLPCGN